MGKVQVLLGKVKGLLSKVQDLLSKVHNQQSSFLLCASSCLCPIVAHIQSNSFAPTKKYTLSISYPNLCLTPTALYLPSFIKLFSRWCTIIGLFWIMD